jgi:hypothetical protein
MPVGVPVIKKPMKEKIEVSATPDVMPETQKVMDDLRAKGHTFEGDTPKVEPKLEIKEVVPKEEPKLEKPPDEEKIHPERKPREPKMIPAWQAEIDKKRLIKESEEKSAQEKQEWRDAISKLESKIEKLEGTKQEKKEEVGEWIDKLVTESGVEMDVGFLKSFANELLKQVPKPESKIPDELPKALETVAKMESKVERERENSEYESSFKEEVVPKIKEEYPQITEDEIGSIRESMRKPYFSERFITLSSGEIYELTKGTFKDLIAPERRQTVEKGTKGISRNQKVLDYSNLTDEDYKNMTPQEREEANKFLLKS